MTFLRRGIACAWVGALVALACGEAPPATPDAAVLADAGPNTCQPDLGRTYIMKTFAGVPAPEGLDIDDDGIVDNEVGKLPPPVLEEMNRGLRLSIEAGEMIIVYSFSGWSEPPTATDPDLDVALLTARDHDVPPDPTNNYGGAGEFWINPLLLDLDCRPTVRTDRAWIENLEFRAEANAFRFPLATQTGTLEVLRTRYEGRFEPDFSRMTGRVGAIVPYCSLAATPAPGDVPGTVLDAFVNDPTLAAALHADKDLDGDGLEQVIGDGASVVECVDGDGTVIPGRDCPCHPAIVDGYSVAFDTELVPAVVHGVM